LITDPVTVNIRVGWGEVADGIITPSVAAEESFSGAGGTNVSYSQLRDFLTTTATSAADATAVSNLPTGDPTSGGHYFIAPALEKAWGLLPADGSELDGSIGFNSALSWTFDPNNRAVPNARDCIGVALHELTHALGRVAGLQQNGPNYFAPQDLFHYTAPGSLQLSEGSTAGYFSIDGGITNLSP
jgi:hypothetical protein